MKKKASNKKVPDSMDTLRKMAGSIEAALSGRQKVCATPCNQCLFTRNKIVSEERKAELLKACEEEQTHFNCHKGTIIGENVVCNGFFRNRTTPFLDIMKSIGHIDMVDPVQLENGVPSEQNAKNKKGPTKATRRNPPRKKC